MFTVRGLQSPLRISLVVAQMCKANDVYITDDALTTVYEHLAA